MNEHLQRNASVYSFTRNIIWTLTQAGDITLLTRGRLLYCQIKNQSISMFFKTSLERTTDKS